MIQRFHIWRRRLAAPKALLALLLACNYFAFRAELFSSEEELNHPVHDCFPRTVSLTASTLNWETFDKDNAPKAITLRVRSGLVFTAVVPVPPLPPVADAAPAHPVRDKSPPSAAPSI